MSEDDVITPAYLPDSFGHRTGKIEKQENYDEDIVPLQVAKETKNSNWL